MEIPGTGQEAPRVVPLDADGVAEACRQTHALWRQGLELRPYTLRVQEALARMDGEMRYVGLFDESGELAGSARELDGSFVMQGTKVGAMGIAAVFVRGDRRRKGLGRMLVRALLSDARERGCSAAFLFSDIQPDFYAACGFQSYPAMDWSAQAGRLPDRNALAIRRARPDDADKLRVWHEERLARAVLSPRRTPRWWDYFRWWRGATDDYVLCDGAGEVGYVNLRAHGGSLRVYEWAAPGVEPDRVWATVRGRAADLGADRVQGWLQPGMLRPWMTVAVRRDAIPMVAPLRDGLALPGPDDAVFEELDHF
jgi:GNAT superfamily N-acetyltransferase